MEDAVEVSQSRRRRVQPPSTNTKRHVAAKMLASACRAGALDLVRRLAAGVARKVALTLPSVRTAAAACCAVAVALLLCGAAAAYFCRRGVSARRGRGRIKAGERQKQGAVQLVGTNANPSPGAMAGEQRSAGQEQHQVPPPAPEPVASETPSRSMETEQELLVDTNTPGGTMATSDQLPAGNQQHPPPPSPRRTARPRQPSRRYSSSEWVL